MRTVRQDIGGLGNILFKNAFLWGLMRAGAIPDIYVQSHLYWLPYQNEIRALYGAGIGHDSRVALHIRRGDYLKVSQFHTNLWDTNYYKEAVKQFPENTKYLVFCKDNQGDAQDADDREWCERNLPSLGIDFELYTHGTETDDLNAMAACAGIIMANSSFSWWAAFLGDDKKKVVTPHETKWFIDGKVRTELPDNWVRL